MKRIANIITSLGMLAAIFLPGAASALTYSPPAFDLIADPGQTLNQAVKVYNESAEAITIEARAVNFKGKDGDETSGVPEFLPADSPSDGHELAPWISFLVPSVTVAPGENGRIPFQIRVPSDASPGSHFGAVVRTTMAPGGQPGVGVLGNSASLVLLRVNGDVKEELRLTSFTAMPMVGDSLPVRFAARLENHGNVHERPYGEVIIRNMFGRTVATLPMNRADNKSVLPNAARRLETDWVGRPLPGKASRLARQWRNFAIGPYTAELSLQHGTQQKITATAGFWVIPWLALSVMLIGGLILAMLVRSLLRWHRKRVIAQLDMKE